MFALRNHRYKLTVHEGKREELFDVEADPEELVNLAETEPELRDKMMDQLKSWRAHLTPGGATASTVEVGDPESMERLRSLGYVK